MVFLIGCGEADRSCAVVQSGRLFAHGQTIVAEPYRGSIDLDPSPDPYEAEFRVLLDDLPEVRTGQVIRQPFLMIQFEYESTLSVEESP